MDTTIDNAKFKLERDEIVAIPTETVYGLAGNAFSEKAVKKIFDLKKRPLFNPLIVHIGSIEDLDKVARDIPEKAIILARSFWPGPLTLILKKQDRIPSIVTSGKDTVAVRIPNHKKTLELLRSLPFPLAAPSANPFGSISPTTSEHVRGYFGEQLGGILEGGPCERGIESTIVGFDSLGQPVIYRYGSLSAEEIEQVTGPLRFLTHEEEQPTAPGMLLKHYSPKTKSFLTDNITETLTSLEGKRVGLLLFKDRVLDRPDMEQEILSPTGDMGEAARNLYAAMHRLDQKELDIIVFEQFPQHGLGVTINDKLKRAAQD